MQLRPLVLSGSQLGLAVALWLGGLGLGGVAAQTGRPPHRRALPPQLDASATADIFFDDVFSQGVVGRRPINLRATAMPHRQGPTAADRPTAKPGKPQPKKPRRKR